MKSEDVWLIVGAISFQDFQLLLSWSTNVTDGQTDRWHAISIPRYALLCGKNDASYDHAVFAAG